MRKTAVFAGIALVSTIGFGLTACAASSSSDATQSQALDKTAACAKLKELLPGMAEAIASMQSDTANVAQHATSAQSVIAQVKAVTSSDANLQAVSSNYATTLSTFITELESALSDGGTASDPSITSSRDAAREAGAALDAACK